MPLSRAHAFALASRQPPACARAVNPRVLFVSRRIMVLRVTSLVLVGQVALVAWLLSLAPRSEWSNALGERMWWMIPAALLAFSLVLPAAMAWLNGRYVLSLEINGGTVTIVTFLVWGRRTRSFRREELTAGSMSTAPSAAWSEATQVTTATALRVRVPRLQLDLLFDREGDFPEGEAAVEELFAARDLPQRHD